MSDDVANMLERARKTLDKALTALDEAQDRVTEKLANADEYDDKLGSHLAWTAGKISEILSSLRQLEKHDRHMSRTPEQRFRLVLEYVRSEASPEQRVQIRDVLAQVDDVGRVLA